MRDSKRINPIMERLEKLWLENPDYRLGQLIMVITKTGEINPKLFNMEDDKFLEKLEETEELFTQIKKNK